MLVDTCHHTFGKTRRLYDPKSEAFVSYGLWVMMPCPCRLSKCEECSSLVREVDSRGASACVGVGGRWELYFLLSCAVDLKLL